MKFKSIDDQLKKNGIRLPFWIHPEAHELTKILSVDESIQQAVSGRYSGGFALLCATDLRLLLIDKRLMSLTLEDVRYDMISEVDFRQRPLDATVCISTLNKTLRFTSLRKLELRQLMKSVQGMTMGLRQAQAAPVFSTVPSQFSPAIEPLQAMATPQQSPQPLVQVTPVGNRGGMNINPYTKLPLVTRERMMRLYTGT